MAEWLVLTIAMAATCAVLLAVILLSQSRHGALTAGEEPREVHTPDVLEYMTMMIGVVYAIVLGLAMAGVWEARGAAQDNVRREAQALHEITQRAEVLPADVRTRIRADIGEYVSYVVHTEWPRMTHGKELSPRGGELLEAVRKDITRRTPANSLEAQVYQPMVEQAAVAFDARITREENAGATLPVVVWYGLIGGAVATIGLIFTMRMGGSSRELLIAGLFSALITFLLFLVWDFDAPFGRAGSETATADAFRRLFPGST
ncbi:membrane protein [Streptomyces inusitatus]|uniref:Membrane protein n=1 Tax=Streptomyces inusitatus TaxID=68221 RepID=A0A918PNA0_9ACTN|nr:DUF4239 domain-containing protein [Streptomyces inusitatus]GGZ15571.1 membrane protein [Streptomyces inusitatus]